MSFEFDQLHRAPPRPAAQTAHVRDDAFCARCGWPVILAHCNDRMAQIAPYAEWNAWTYCTNKACKHHEGEGVFHNMPSWIKSIAPKLPPAGPARQMTAAARPGGRLPRQRKG
jgi:hypothetical protein